MQHSHSIGSDDDERRRRRFGVFPSHSTALLVRPPKLSCILTSITAHTERRRIGTRKKNNTARTVQRPSYNWNEPPPGSTPHRANDRPESKSLYIWMTSTVRTSVSSVVVLGAVVVVVVQCWITKLLDKGK